MAKQTGTATDYHDLLNKLRLFAEANGWSTMAYSPGATLEDEARLYLQGPGTGLNREVYVNIMTRCSPTVDAWCWIMRGATGYTPGLDWGLQPGETDGEVALTLWTSTIDYRFWINDRRIIIVAQTGLYVNSAYLGYGLPTCATPAEYPYPLYVAGDYSGLSGWSNQNSGRRFFVDPASGSAYARRPGGTWTSVANQEFSTDVDHPRLYSNYFVWPWHSGEASDVSDIYGPGDRDGQSSGGMLDAMVPNGLGEIGAAVVYIGSMLEPPLMFLEGVLCPWGNGLTPFQSITIGVDTYVAVPNVFRGSGNDFMLIEDV